MFNERKGRLKCDPEALPRPTEFKWYKDGKSLTSARYSVAADGTLVIDKVNSEDAGKYSCYAKNIVGEARSKPANATVFGKNKIFMILFCLLSLKFVEAKINGYVKEQV